MKHFFLVGYIHSPSLLEAWYSARPYLVYRASTWRETTLDRMAYFDGELIVLEVAEVLEVKG